MVTGAASGMGAATATILTRLGARVTALDVRPTEASVDRALEVDLRDRASIEKAAEAIEGPEKVGTGVGVAVPLHWPLTTTPFFGMAETPVKATTLAELVSMM